MKRRKAREWYVCIEHFEMVTHTGAILSPCKWIRVREVLRPRKPAARRKP